MLRATTACTFSSLIWPADSASAALASLLFDPPEPQIIGKTQCFATFLPFRLFAHLHLLSSYSFSSDLLSSNLPLLSTSALLCFSSVHIVGSLTSKLPSISALTLLCAYNRPRPSKEGREGRRGREGRQTRDVRDVRDVSGTSGTSGTCKT